LTKPIEAPPGRPPGPRPGPRRTGHEPGLRPAAVRQLLDRRLVESGGPVHTTERPGCLPRRAPQTLEDVDGNGR
jgi:hypothetical protein